MSGNNGFGFVEIENNKVRVCYGRNDDGTQKASYYDNPRFVQALKLLELVEERIRKNREHKHYEESHDEKSICLRCSVLELQSLLDVSKETEESKK